MGTTLLLVLALIVFLASTIQFKRGWRLATWLIGALLLGLAGVQALGRGHALVQLIAEGPTNALNIGASPIILTITANWRLVQEAIEGLTALLLAPAAILAIVGLIALTPGDRIERVIRPAKLALISAILGAVGAVSLIALGFGGVTDRRVYIGSPTADDVLDGDTIAFGDTHIRLWGMDAPEFDRTYESDQTAPTENLIPRHNQVCLARNAASPPTPCGERARLQIIALIENALVICTHPQDESGVRDLRNAFGRPIARCRVWRHGQSFDLAERMIASGHALAWLPRNQRPPPNYRCAELSAEGARLGVWDSPSVMWPDYWRSSTEAERAAYLRLEPTAAPPDTRVRTPRPPSVLEDERVTFGCPASGA